MTYQGYALLRSILKSGSDADVAKAVAYGKRIKLYPLSQAAIRRRRPSSMRSTSSTTARFPTTCASSSRSTGSCRSSHGCARDQADDRHAEVDRHREGQAVQTRCKDTRDPERGRREAHACSMPLRDRIHPLFRQAANGRCRLCPNGTNHEDVLQSGCLSRSMRAGSLYLRLLHPKHLGTGQFYLMTIKDKDGQRSTAPAITGSPCPPTRR